MSENIELLAQIRRLADEHLENHPGAIPASKSPGMKLATMDLSKATPEGIGNWTMVNLTLELMRRGASFQSANEIAEAIMKAEYRDLWEPGNSLRETQRRRNMAADYVVAEQLLHESKNPPASVVNEALWEIYDLVDNVPEEILRAVHPTGGVYVAGWPRPFEPAVVYAATANF